MKTIKNQQGNTVIFVISFMGIMSLMFILIASFAKVYVTKERASNNAEQASLVASSVVFEEVTKAIEEYDRSLTGKAEEILDKSISEKITKKMNSLGSSFLSDTELKMKATNLVLKEEISGNPILKGYIDDGLNTAMTGVLSTVQSNIEENKGKISGTKIKFNSDSRIEVQTSFRYTSLKFDEYFPEEKRYVKQSGEGPSFDFIDQLLGWSSWSYTYP